MTRPPSKATHVHMHIITWPCREHGPHRLIMASLDDTSDYASQVVLDAHTMDGERPSHRRIIVPLEVARVMSGMEGLDLEDLPY